MSQDLFREKAPTIMDQLIADFNWGDTQEEEVLGAAAVLGNLGHECNGFESFQELKPTVPGSRGGFGWAQWTGSRRKKFEAYCKRNKLDVFSDKANYGWLFVELKGPEKMAVKKVALASGLTEKVKAFELAYERSGVKNYPSRNKWAQIALEAYRQRIKSPAPIPSPPPAPPTTTRDVSIGAALMAVITALFGFVVYYFGG